MSRPESNRPSQDGPPVARWNVLAFGLVVFGLALALLHPYWSRSDAGIQLGHDAVSLAFGRLRLASNPRDSFVRRAYARQLLASGQAAKANEVLLSIAREPESFDLWLELQVGLLRSADGEVRAARANALGVELDRRIKEGVEDDVLDQFIAAALELQQPDLAATWAGQRADRDNDLGWRIRAAELASSSGNSKRAATHWAKVAKSATNGRLFRRALAGLMAAGEHEEAWRQLEARSEDDSLIDLAIRLALSTGKNEQALVLSHRRLALPNVSKGALERHITLALAAGRPGEALRAARELARRYPLDLDVVRRWATVARWSGRPDEALVAWERLVELGDPDARAEADALARGLGDLGRAYDRLDAKAAKRCSTARQLLRLIELAEKLGAPERARRRVAEQARRCRFDSERFALVVAFMERLADFDAMQFWYGRWAEGPGLNDATHLARAQLAARREQWTAALGLLDERRPPPELKDSWYLLEGDISYRLGISERALAAYLETSELPEDRVGRVFVMLNEAGRSRDAVVWVIQRAPKNPGLVTSAAALAAGEDLWPEFGQLLDGAPELKAELLRRPMYWSWLAQRAAFRGDRVGVRVARERASQLDPDNPRLLADLLWLLLELDDEERLRIFLARGQRSALRYQTLWPAYAAAHHRLKNWDEALFWYRRRAETRPQDWQFYADWSEVYVARREVDAAIRVRQFGLRHTKPKDPRARLLLGRELLSPERLEAEAWKLVRRVQHDRNQERPLVRRVEDRVAAAGWFLDSQRPEEARHAVGDDLDSMSDDLRLRLALAEDDRGTIENIVASDSELSPALRSEAWARLGRSKQALSAALEIRPFPAVLVSERLDALTQNAPNRAHAQASYDRISDLVLRSVLTTVAVSTERTGAGLEVEAADLKDASGIATLQKVDEIRVEAHAWLRLLEQPGNRAIVRINGGVVSREAKTRPRFGATASLQLGRSALHLRGRFGDMQQETGLLRARAQYDQLEVRFDTRIAGWSTSARIDAHRWRGFDSGRRLATGLSAEALLARPITTFAGFTVTAEAGVLGINRWLADALPAEFADLGARGFGIEGVVARRVLVLSSGLFLSRGLLDLPQSNGKLRLLVGGRLGFQLPGARPAYSLELGFGMPVFGPDELKLQARLQEGLGIAGDLTAGVTIAWLIRF